MRRWGSFAHRFERLGTAAERTGTPLPTNGPAEHGWCSSMGGVPGGLSQHPVSPGGRGVPSCTMSPFHHTRPCFPRDGTCVGPYNKYLECCGKGLGCCDKRLWLLCPIYRAYFPQDKRPVLLRGGGAFLVGRWSCAAADTTERPGRREPPQRAIHTRVRDIPSCSSMTAPLLHQRITNTPALAPPRAAPRISPT